jgi:hypothetical protein
MQITPQSTTLFFSRRDKVFPQALQILCEGLQFARQAYGVDGISDLLGQVI